MYRHSENDERDKNAIFEEDIDEIERKLKYNICSLKINELYNLSINYSVR
jgi:hypothetical protein